MPTYEFACENCEIIFEELLLSTEEISKYSASHPCKECGKIANRIPSAASFVFKGKSEGDPTKKGGSGFHDLDYHTLDKAIGRSANRKWKMYDARKAERDKVRKESGTNAITVDGNNIAPADPVRMEIRKKAMNTMSRAKKSNS
jgi:putative FmdB family regulatory protein